MPAVERPRMDVDVVCAGFGPATAGFLVTLGRALVNEDGTPRLDSRVAPGLPLQVLCFERADDFGAGVSGVATRARGILQSFPEFGAARIPLSTPITGERLVYLLDPIGASRRSRSVRAIDRLLRTAARLVGLDRDAVTLPWIPSFLRKHGGFAFSMGQFGQWVSGEIMAGGAVQIWPSSPVTDPLFDATPRRRVAGVRLVDQGTDSHGDPSSGYAPGMDVYADLTVVGDGPVGAVGRALDEAFGLPAGHGRDEWALGMKMVVDLREDASLEPGTIVHTLGFPEPEIFGFMYALAPKTVSIGIFVPSWFRSPARSAYRYLQHWMLHPYLWQWLEGGTLRSWGAKSVQDAGRRGEPYLVGDGYARIGEGSGSTNALTGSGVDEAWTTGAQLAEAVIELARAGAPFTRENLERTYVARRRASWLDRELRAADGARDGFQRGILRGLMGVGLAGLTAGRLHLPGRRRVDKLPSLEEYFGQQLSHGTIEKIVQESRATGQPMHDALMERCGWPPIPYDGRLLVTHQDALILGGKVQAAPGYADHVRFMRGALCGECRTRLCVEMCSGQAIVSDGEAGVTFDREKCVHCGACVWNCGQGNVVLDAGAGGLHSVEN